MDEMQHLLLSTACYEVENFIFDACNDDVTDFAERILPYRLLLPTHLIEPLINFIYNELATASSLLDNSPAMAELIIWQTLVYNFQCLRQKLFVSCINNETTPLVVLTYRYGDSVEKR